MSIDKVQMYVDRQVKSKYRKGYLELLGLIQDKDTMQGLHTFGSIDRVSQLVGIGTNNRAENFPFDATFLSVTEKYEQQAQLEFNKEYMHRIEELDKLRISDAVSQLSQSLQPSSLGSFKDFKSNLSSNETDKGTDLFSEGSFEIPSLQEDEYEEVESSDEVDSDEFLSAEDSSDFVVSDNDTGEPVSFLSLFSDLE